MLPIPLQDTVGHRTTAVAGEHRRVAILHPSPMPGNLMSSRLFQLARLVLRATVVLEPLNVHRLTTDGVAATPWVSQTCGSWASPAGRQGLRLGTASRATGRRGQAVAVVWAKVGPSSLLIFSILFQIDLIIQII
jgi:hypothetical protein